MLTSVTDPRGVTRTYAYDASGVQWRETDDYGQSKYTYQGRRGLVDSTRSRSLAKVSVLYDPLGHRTNMSYPQVISPDPSFASATVPGGALAYQYDLMGNLTQATSTSDTISRTYYLDGSLKRKISTVGPRTDTVSYSYDATGAVAQLVHGRDTVTYAYVPTTGDLQTVTVTWGGRSDGPRVFSFLWDALGRRRQITYPTDPSGPNDMTVKFRYDAAGILRRVVSDHPGAPSGNPNLDVFDFTWRSKSVDAVGRAWRQELDCRASSSTGNPCGTGTSRWTDNQYNRSGMLTRQQVNGATPDVMRYDASGNMIYRETYDKVSASFRTHTYTIDSTTAAAHNQLAKDQESPNIFTRNPLIMLYTADAARRWDKPDPYTNDFRERYYYYDGLGRMAGSIARSQDANLQKLEHPNSCVYDPDGQLALACAETGGAYLSFDSHNVSGVLFTPNGTYPDRGWRFADGPATDDVLTGLYRGPEGDRILYWVTDGAGRQLAVADSTGYRSADDALPARGAWRYAGAISASESFNADRQGGGDIPQVAFFRNRGYDQFTGRWLQEDPIGVAGGLNLYQFNGNNPVNYSDPFGLCPTCLPALVAGVAVGGIRLGANLLSDRPAFENVGRDAIFAGAAVLTLGAAVPALAAATTTTAGTATATAAASGGTLQRIGNALEAAGPGMDARVTAVARIIGAQGKEVLMQDLPEGAKLLSGGAGPRHGQVILNADGSSVVQAYNVAKDVYETVRNIKP